MSATEPMASEITVQETLALLDDRFNSFASGVAEDRYAFWLGSGISFGRVDGLRELISKVIEFLRSQVDFSDPGCPFGRALQEVMELAPVSADERAATDLTAPFEGWPYKNEIVSRLSNNYARLLDTNIDGESDDYLLWNGIDIIGTFADPAKEPDVEHLCMAILVLEGVASEITTANWDGLIEKAAYTMANGNPAVVVCVLPGELRQAKLMARLAKFHGCAVCAANNESGYRPYLVGRHSQISGWVEKVENRAMVTHLVSVAIQKPTLMIGLSAQDANIQQVFARAEATMPWPWPGDCPSIVFANNAIGNDQNSLLKNVYRDEFSPEQRDEIRTESLIRAYGKPLLVALVISVLTRKFLKLIDLASSSLTVADKERLANGIIVVRNAAVIGIDANLIGFISAVVSNNDRAFRIFREGIAPSSPGVQYQPITTFALQHFAGDTSLPATGLCEAAVGAGLLGIGVEHGYWTMGQADATIETSGTAKISAGTGEVRVFLTSNSHTALRLEQAGCYDNEENVIVIQSLEIVPKSHRSPRRAPGRTGIVERRKVSIRELLNEVTCVDDLVQRFREEVAL